ASGSAQDGDVQGRLEEDTWVGVLHRSRDPARRESGPEGHAQDAEGRAAPPALLTPLPPPHVRALAAPAGRVARVRPAAAWARLDSAHRRYVREVVAYGKQGGCEPPRRRKW